MKPSQQFFDAATLGDISTLKEILNDHPDVQLDAYRGFGQNGGTSLILAVEAGHVTTAEFLLDAGADVNKCNQTWGCSPLLLAAEKGNVEMVRMLLGHSAHIDLCDRGGRSPLIAASEHGHSDVVRILLSTGANTETMSRFETIPKHIREGMNNSKLTAYEMNDIKEPFCKNTAFFKACWGGHVDTLKILVTHGCRVHVTNHHGNTGLHIASRMGHVTSVQELIGLELLINSQNSKGETPLHTSCKQLFSNVLDLGVPKSLKDVEQFAQISVMLIQNGCDLNIKDTNGKNVLYTLLTGEFSNTEAIHELNKIRLRLIRLVLSVIDRISLTDLPQEVEIPDELSSSHRDLLSWLNDFAKTPRSLQHMARCVIRKQNGALDCSLPYNELVNKCLIQ